MVEGARLESVYTATYRGFESLSLRHLSIQYRPVKSIKPYKNKNEQGNLSDMIERQLAHAERNAVKAAYCHAEYLPERRKMMQSWADYLDGLKNGAEILAQVPSNFTAPKIVFSQNHTRP